MSTEICSESSLIQGQFLFVRDPENVSCLRVMFWGLDHFAPRIFIREAKRRLVIQYDLGIFVED